MALGEAVKVGFRAQLPAIEVPEALGSKVISVKLILDGPDGALEKLANAAGARLEKQGEKLVVVAGQ